MDVQDEVTGFGGRQDKLGDEAAVLFVVRSGAVELTMPLSVRGADHELDVVVGEASQGETVAWSALIEPHRCTMSARAGSDVEPFAE